MGATATGTESYFSSFPLFPGAEPSRFGKAGWAVSPFGFGSYRIHDREPAHREALKLALQSGCNLIDTSANYTLGGSELLIGQVLTELFGAGILRREQIVVITKAGYLQGENLDRAKKLRDEGRGYPDIVEYAEQCWHSISPEFLEDQITRSLKRLGLAQLDALLLHNPEYYLEVHGDHAEYYRRVRRAFEHLESEVARGRIQYYGVSSNAFPEPKEASVFTSLEALWETAQSIGPKHHFGIIQLPLNLFEPGAALEPNNSGKSVLELARELDLAVMINRPLNAFVGNRLIRLADFPPHDVDRAEIRFQQALNAAMELEATYTGDEIFPASKVCWGHILRQNFEKLKNIESWKHLYQWRIQPAMKEAAFELSSTSQTKEWLDRYSPLAQELFSSFNVYLEALASSDSIALGLELARACPGLRTQEKLSQKALRVYRSLPGVSCTLVGMRSPQYVRDVMKPKKTFPALSPIEAIQALETGARIAAT